LGGFLMSDNEEKKATVKVEEIKNAVTKFKDDLGALVKDLQIDVDTWRFGVESQKEVVKVDVAFSLTIKQKTEKKE
jgi:hypothetical protein